MDEKVKDTMDDSDLALERALQRVGGEGEDAEETSDTDSETESPDAVLNDAIERISDTGMGEPNGCMYPGKGLNTSYRHHHALPGSNDQSMNGEQVARSPPVGAPSSCEMSVPLSTIIEDDRTFLMFRRFLKDQCITRNLNFWLACEHYRQIPAGDQPQLQNVARAIYIKFIKCSAPQYVTILDQSKKLIKMSLELRSSRLNPQLYETAQHEIWDVMERNELRQFLVSDSFTDCSVFTDMGSQVSASIYAPGVTKPAYNHIGGGSRQLTDSEDSTSVTSFPSDDGSSRSTAVFQLTRPVPSTARNAISDNEDSRRRRMPPSQHHQQRANLTKEKQVSEEEFAALVRDRLQAVQKDREAMRRKAQDWSRKEGKSYEEIMASEWYILPEAVKYLQFDVPVPGSRPDTSQDHNQPMPPSVKHVMSPSVHSPAATPRGGGANKPRAHINSLALREIQDALKDLEITNQVKKRRSHTVHNGGSVCSSACATTSDSGVGDSWATTTGEVPMSLGTMTPQNNVRNYLRNQAMQSMGERDRLANAAAIALINNSPQQEALNPYPRVPSTCITDSRDRHRRGHHGGFMPHNYSGAYSTDDSSSCFTMTSQSSTSDLFIPRARRLPNTAPSFYSDSDEPHHYPPPNRYHHGHGHVRRQLTTPKRSHHLHQKHTSTPPPIMDQRMTPSRQSDDVLVVYHLDDFPTPYAKRVGGSQITLRDFKEMVFARKGDFRYFFKSYCEDLGMEIMEEFSDDTALLPLMQGKVMGKVEKA